MLNTWDFYTQRFLGLLGAEKKVELIGKEN